MPRRPWSWTLATLGLGIALSLLAEAVVSSLLKGSAHAPGLLAASGDWWHTVPAVTRALASLILLISLLAFLATRLRRPSPAYPYRHDSP